MISICSEIANSRNRRREPVFDSRHREGLDRPSRYRSYLFSLAPPRNLKGFPSGIDDTRRSKEAGVCKLLSSYRNVCAFKTLSRSWRWPSCGNSRRNLEDIDGDRFLLSFPFFFPRCFFFFFFKPKATSSQHPRRNLGGAKLFITQIARVEF